MVLYFSEDTFKWAMPGWAGQPQIVLTVVWFSPLKSSFCKYCQCAEKVLCADEKTFRGLKSFCPAAKTGQLGS